MDKFYQTIILGASMKGLGYAFTHRDTLILEPGEMPAPEYTLAFHPARQSRPRDGALEKLLLKDGILTTDGCLDPLSLSAGLCHFCAEQKVPIRFLARPLTAEEENGGYGVTFYGSEGLCTVWGKSVINEEGKERGQWGQRSLNAVCHAPPPGFEARLFEMFPLGVQILPTHQAEEYLVRFAVTASAALPDARRMITEGVREAFPQGDLKISALAFQFDRWELPHPLDAFAAGMEKEEAR